MNNTRLHKDVLGRWLDEIQNQGKDLTKWEENYVEDMIDQLAATDTVSERQEEIIKRIYDEKTPLS